MATLSQPGSAAALPRHTMLPALPEPAFDKIAELTRRVVGVPTALVSLVDRDRQAFPGAAGLPEPWSTQRETPLTHSFCQHVVTSAAPLLISDARQHPVLSSNLAIEDIGVVAYAGMPLTNRAGEIVGSLCAIDSAPREWTDEQRANLADLAAACFERAAPARGGGRGAVRGTAHPVADRLDADRLHRLRPPLAGDGGEHRSGRRGRLSRRGAARQDSVGRVSRRRRHGVRDEVPAGSRYRGA